MRKRYLIYEITIWTVIFAIFFTGAIFAYSKLFVEPNVYVIQFQDIDGITKGSPVRFMGINVGYVRKLKAKGKYVDVSILVTEKNLKIPNGTIARVEFYGLGGSKSIELMPSETDNNKGIVTGDNIRLNDIVLEAIGFVNVIEEIEKVVKNIDKKSLENVLDNVNDIKSSYFDNINDNFENIKINTTTKFNGIKNKEKFVEEKVERFKNIFKFRK